jgi:hypothetical protein
MALWTISFFTAFLAICGDHGVFSSRIFSDAKNVKKYCGSTRQLDFAVLISGTLSDLLTVLLPIPMVRVTQRKHRICRLIYFERS